MTTVRAEPRGLAFTLRVTAIGAAATLSVDAYCGVGVVRVTVPGTASPWLAGMADGTSGCNCNSSPGADMVPSNAPVVVGLGSVQAGDTVSIEAFGATCHGPDKEMCGDDADGILSSAPCLNCGSLNGIAGTCAPRTALMGVFLSDTAPNGTTTPPPLSFTTAESRNFETLAPLLKQVFFIGDGRTDGGEAQRFVVPNGATRLYLGTMDNCGWWNNEGEISVVVRLTATRVVGGTASPWLAGMADGTSGCNCNGPEVDSAPTNSPVFVGLGSIQVGDTITFDSAGAACYGPTKDYCGSDADGIVSSAPCLNCGSLNGIAGTCAPRTALMGVFLSDTAPNGTTTPPPLSFTTAESRSFETLAPLLKQVFFIGDGRTDGGEAQRFVVPNGATRLYLGTMDNCGWWNNEGEIAVNVSLQESCGADLNNDATVNGADISVLLGYWGQSGNGVVGDITGDGIVNGADLAQLLGSWGPCQ